jgi:hypothetical protein
MSYTYFDHLQDCVKRGVLSQSEMLMLWDYNTDIQTGNVSTHN